MDEAKAILERIKKPLAFASKDDFAHIKSLAALESFMRTQLEALRKVQQGRSELDELEKVFSSFDGLLPEQKKSEFFALLH